MSEIIKTKFLCKNGSRTAPRGSFDSIKWKDRFIEGKWYDGEYETWSWEDGYRINDGWRKYWVINESGEKEEIPKQNKQSEDVDNIVNAFFDYDQR